MCPYLHKICIHIYSLHLVTSVQCYQTGVIILYDTKQNNALLYGKSLKCPMDLLLVALTSFTSVAIEPQNFKVIPSSLCFFRLMQKVDAIAIFKDIEKYGTKP